MDTTTRTPEQEMNDVLGNAIIDFDAEYSRRVVYALYGIIASQQGSCPYSLEDIEVWLNSGDCLE